MVTVGALLYVSFAAFGMNVEVADVISPGDRSTCHIVDDRAVQRMRMICGLNSIYMLLKSHGIPVQFSDVEHFTSMTERGVTLLAMRNTASHFGLPARVRRCSIDALKMMNLPAIAHLRSTMLSDSGAHYVLLLSVSDERTVYVDGTSGLVQEVPLRKFDVLRTGYVLEPLASTLTRHAGVALGLFLFCILAALLVWMLWQKAKPRYIGLRRVSAIVLPVAIWQIAGDSINAAPASEMTWRSPTCDALNVLDLYLRLSDRCVPRSEVASAIGGANHRASLSDLKEGSRKLGIRFTVLKASINQLAKLPLPAIVLLYDDGEKRRGYYLLIGSSKNEYQLVNGGHVAFENLTEDDFRRRWSGYVLAASADHLSWSRSIAIGCTVIAGYGFWRFSNSLPRNTAEPKNAVASPQLPCTSRQSAVPPYELEY